MRIWLTMTFRFYWTFNLVFRFLLVLVIIIDTSYFIKIVDNILLIFLFSLGVFLSLVNVTLPILPYDFLKIIIEKTEKSIIISNSYLWDHWNAVILVINRIYNYCIFVNIHTLRWLIHKNGHRELNNL